MGKLEKSVVLVVLFLISVIMVVSLSSEKAEEIDPRAESLASRVAQPPVDPSPETSTPLPRRETARFAEPTPVPENSLSAQDTQVAQLERAARAQRSDLDGSDGLVWSDSDSVADELDGTTEADSASGSQAPRTGTVGLLNSSVGEAPANDRRASRNPRGLTLQPDWDLVSVAGLERSPNPTFLIHVCSRGETYETLAHKLYGDPTKAGLLRRNNEGLRRLSAGLEILVPVADDRGMDSGEYVVREGESLWVIAKEFYGQGARWGEIFEANRDQLTSPESVREGMTLRIP